MGVERLPAVLYYVGMEKKKRILTGIKPTGEVHLGNYFGAIREMVRLQEDGEMFLFVADLHALTSLSDGGGHDAEAFRMTGDNLLRAYIALGINPDRVVIYRQSEFPQIAELAWMFSCLVKMQFLSIGHAYKDAMQKGGEPGLGVFLYPALMAADILLPSAEVVPVGADQIQHIEIAREFARKFNTATGSSVFAEPQERVLDETRVVSGTDGGKMSKSKNNILPIFGDEAMIRKRIAGIVTDSTPAGEAFDPGVNIVCDYLRLVMPSDEYGTIANKCSAGGMTHKELKDLLAERYLAYFKDAREKYKVLGKSSGRIASVLAKHRNRVDALLTERLNDARNALGLPVVRNRRGLFR